MPYEPITQHNFQDESLLKLALTHSSCDRVGGDNQRLEFLGDAVLDLKTIDLPIKMMLSSSRDGVVKCWR